MTRLSPDNYKETDDAKILGEGGFSKVSRIMNVKDNKIYALKKIN